MGANVAAVAKQSENQAERAESVILIAELRNFTRMSEMLEPARVLGLADQFFECAAQAVAKKGGQSMAVHNDSLVAVFRGAATRELARAAVRAAQQLFGEFDAIVQAWEREYGLRTAIALGMHRGEAVFGEAGPAAQRNAVVFGDCVSITERLVHRARAGELVFSDALMDVISVAELELDAQPLPPLELHNRPSIRIYGVLRDDRLDFTS
ncbi:MAG TPA: adenylate/guanylate cyclase domain-containing protein [Burkholderiales bacterium]